MKNVQDKRREIRKLRIKINSTSVHTAEFIKAVAKKKQLESELKQMIHEDNL